MCHVQLLVPKIISIFPLVKFFFPFCFQVADCYGTFELQILEIENIRGELTGGECCGGTPRIRVSVGDRSDNQSACMTSCRTFFKVCLKEYQSNMSAVSGSCSYGNASSPVLGGNSFTLADPDRANGKLIIRFKFSWTVSTTLVLIKLRLTEVFCYSATIIIGSVFFCPQDSKVMYNIMYLEFLLGYSRQRCPLSKTLSISDKQQDLKINFGHFFVHRKPFYNMSCHEKRNKRKTNIFIIKIDLDQIFIRTLESVFDSVRSRSISEVNNKVLLNPQPSLLVGGVLYNNDTEFLSLSLLFHYYYWK